MSAHGIGRGFADAVLEAFKTHRLVGIGEAHGLQNHHDALAMLLADPRLPEVVDDIVVEFGNALYQNTVDRFIDGQPVDNADLRPVWRDTTNSPLATCDEPVYEQFYRTVRAVNWTLPQGRQLRVLLGEPPIDWSKITKAAPIPSRGLRPPASELLVFLRQRDAHAASVVEQHVLDKGHRALLLYGRAHLFHPPPEPAGPPNLVAIIEERTGQRTYTIADLAPYVAGDPGGLARSLSRYSRNTVIPTAGTWLGSFHAGLLAPVMTAGPPAIAAGKNRKPPDPFRGVPLGSLTDAGLYLGQPEDLTASSPNPAIYLDSAYWQELQRRNALQGNPADLESYRQQRPARFPLLELPPSQE